MISFRQRRRATVRAERAAAAADCMRAELARMRAHYEAVAAGTAPGYWLTPERALFLLEHWDDGRGRCEPDPPPAHVTVPPWAERGPALPAYMPAGAPRPMSVRETVRVLNDLGNRVPLWLQLLAACTSPRQLRRAFKAHAGRTTHRLAEIAPRWAAGSAEGSSGWPLSDPGEISALFAYRSETWATAGAAGIRPAIAAVLSGAASTVPP